MRSSRVHAKARCIEEERGREGDQTAKDDEAHRDFGMPLVTQSRRALRASLSALETQ